MDDCSAAVGQRRVKFYSTKRDRERETEREKERERLGKQTFVKVQGHRVTENDKHMQEKWILKRKE